MLVAYPTGRVAPGLERRLVQFSWVAATVLPFAQALVDPNPNRCSGNCPDNLLLVTSPRGAGTVVRAEIPARAAAP